MKKISHISKDWGLLTTRGNDAVESRTYALCGSRPYEAKCFIPGVSVNEDLPCRECLSIMTDFLLSWKGWKVNPYNSTTIPGMRYIYAVIGSQVVRSSPHIDIDKVGSLVSVMPEGSLEMLPLWHRLNRSSANPVFLVWDTLNRRCHDEDHPDFPSWGGSGVTVDPLWDSRTGPVLKSGHESGRLSREFKDGFINFAAAAPKRVTGVFPEGKSLVVGPNSRSWRVATAVAGQDPVNVDDTLTKVYPYGVKYCIQCKEFAKLSEYDIDYRLSDGLSSYCLNKPRLRREYTPRKFKEIKDRLRSMHGDSCLFPGCDETYKLTVDHVVPFLEGGLDDISNYQLLCRSHNSKKGSSHADYRTTVQNGQ